MPKQTFNPPELGPPTAPYSHVARAGDWIYPSGQRGIDANGKLQEGLRAQAILAYENLQRALEAAGGRLEDVVMLRIYLAEGENLGSIRDVRTQFMGPDFPAAVSLPLPKFLTDGVL